MTDNKIIKALECCTNNKGTGSYVDCPLANYAFEECADILRTEAYNLINRQKDKIKEFDERNIIYRGTVEWQAKEINRQKAEIERLKRDIAIHEHVHEESNAAYQVLVKQAKSEAIKEFAERLKHFIIPQKADGYTREIVLKRDIDNLVKEITEVRR